MRLLQYVRMSTLLCAFWVLAVAGVFFVCVGKDISLLLAPPERPLTPTAQATKPGPTLQELIPPDPAPRPVAALPGLPPSPEAPGQTSPEDFVLGEDFFTGVFSLTSPPPAHHVSFQTSPPAWMVDVPGAWRRTGQETYLFTHPVIRKVRILPMKDALRFKFYLTDRSARKKTEPDVTPRETGIAVRVATP